jgi:hypothetical protein
MRRSSGRGWFRDESEVCTQSGTILLRCGEKARLEDRRGSERECSEEGMRNSWNCNG